MAEKNLLDIDYSRYNFKDPELYIYKSRPGLSEEVVEEISTQKDEPEWLRKFRLKSYEIFLKKPMPLWGADLRDVNFDRIHYYIKPSDRKARSWDDVPEYIKKTFDRLGIPEAERNFLAGVGAQYECLTGDTKIFTNPEGVVEIKDIKEGMYVYSFDEEKGELVKSQVKGIAYRGEKKVYEVKVGTRTIKATENHPFLTLRYYRRKGARRGKYVLEWQYLKNLKPGDLVTVVKEFPDDGKPYRFSFSYDENYRHNHVTIPEYTSEDLMWFLGLYLGYGFIHHENNEERVEIAIPDDDEELRREIARVVKQVFSLDVSTNDKYRITIYSTILANFIKAIELGGNAHNKSVPKWVFTLPHSQILAFLGGYLDSDGYVTDNEKNHAPVITSVNYELLQQIRYLCAICGISTSIIHEFESKHPYDEGREIKAYRLELSGPSEKILCRSTKRLATLCKRKYYPNYTSAKGTRFAVHTSKNIGFAKIKSIKYVGVMPVYDIEVDGPHHFVGEGIIVHNSEVVYHNLQKELEKKGVIFVDPDTAFREYADIFKPYFGKVVPPEDNKFAALNSAVFSGGSFIYVPEGVEIQYPLQAYFRINAANVGQFERTLIIAEPYSRVHYIEGCLPPDEKISTGQLMVEISKIKPDDIVVNGNGEETLVKAVRIRNYEGELINITPLSPANSFRLTPEHPVLAVRREDVRTLRKVRNGNRIPEVSTTNLLKTAPQYIPAGELKEGDFIVFPINKETNDNPQYTSDILKLLGYYLSEGSAFIHKKLKVPVVSLALGDKKIEQANEIIELVKKITGREPSIIRDKKKNGLIIVSYSNELMELCLRACGKGASTKSLSREIMLLPPEKQRILLEAYFKGNGSVYTKNRIMIRASTSSEKLAFQLQELLARQGIYASIMIREGSEDTIGSRRIRRNRQYIVYYPPNKKWSGVRRKQDYFLIPIESIKKTYFKGKVYNLEVIDETQSYLAKGFVVHNCTAPIYSTSSLHTAVVEIVAKKGAYVRYTTLQNWSSDVYNLVTKRAHAYGDATVEWVDANVGSKVTMKYPSVYLLGRGARADILSVAFAGRGQHQDTGAKAVHLAPDTTSRITSKSVCKDGGRTSYRGLLHVAKGAKRVKSSVRCDALILDDISRTDTYPYNEINEEDTTATHEASVGKIGEDQLFYLMSRGLAEQEALNMVVLGFLEPFTKTLPMEYAVEFNRLIELEMSGSVG